MFSGALLFTDLPNKIFNFGKMERVFLNISGSSQSTQTRFELVERSLDLMCKYPFGVGIGNWQFKANEFNSSFLIPHKYPHNLFLELINEHGLVVAFLFLFFLIYTLHLSYLKMRRYISDDSSVYSFLFYMSVYLVFNVMLSGSLNDSRLLFVTLCCILIRKPLLSRYEK
jgi:O-antigen ligase